MITIKKLIIITTDLVTDNNDNYRATDNYDN